MKKKAHVNESGEVMLEGLIVYTITVFLLFFLLAIFSVLFQAWNVQTIANETAAKAAATYKLADSDLADPYVSVDQITGISRLATIVWSVKPKPKALNIHRTVCKKPHTQRR